MLPEVAQYLDEKGLKAEIKLTTHVCNGQVWHAVELAVEADLAKIDDGLLDLILLNKVSRIRLLRMFNSIYDGSHVNFKEVEYIQAKKIKITKEKPGKLIPDGEILAEPPVEFECLPRKLQFLWGTNFMGC